MAKGRKSLERIWISFNSSKKKKNNVIRINYINAKIDNTQQNSKYRICGNKGETIRQNMRKILQTRAKEYKIRHDSVRKMIHLELYKK